MFNLAALWFSVLAGEEEELLRKVREAAREPAAWRAEFRVERTGRRSEATRVVRGTMTVRRGEAIRVEIGGKDERLRPGGEFHVLELWGAEGWEERFRVSLGRRAEALPEAVTGPDGTPRPPVRVRLRRGSSLVAAEGRGEDLDVLVLVPREPELRERMAAIRLFVEPKAHRISRAEVETPAHVETWSVGEIHSEE